jgi:hypothetical protein
VDKSSTKKDSKAADNKPTTNNTSSTSSPNKKGKILNDKKLGDENNVVIRDSNKQSVLKDTRTVDIELALDTRGIDSPYKAGGQRESRPLVVDVTPQREHTKSASSSTPLKHQQQQSTIIAMETNVTSTPSSTGLIRSATAGGDMSTPIAVNSSEQQQQQQASPISSNSTGTTINIQVASQPRAPVLSASDAANNSNSFIRGVSTLLV